MSLTVENLSVSFHDRKVLDDLSFSLTSEHLVMLLGRNGSGKTTLFRSILGIQKIKAGKIVIDKQNLLCLNEKIKSRYLSYVPQKSYGSEDFSVIDYVLLGLVSSLKLFDVPGKKEVNKAEAVLKEFGLYDKKDRRFKTLSGGEQQKAVLCRARLADAKWMLLDEPLSGLDYVNQHLFMRQLISYQKSGLQGILMSVHDPNIALSYADEILLLDEGKIVSHIDCSQPDFTEKFYKVFNAICDSHLDLLEGEDNVQFAWKEF